MFLPVLRQLLGYIRGYKRLLAFFVPTLLLDLAFVSLAPLSFQFMIDRAVIPRDMGAFAWILLALAASGIVCLGAGVASDYALARIAALTQRDLRRRLFDRLQSANMGYLQRSRSGELLSLFASDLPAVERALSVLLTTGIQSTVVVAVTLAVLFYLQWTMAVAILLGAVAIYTGPALLRRRSEAVNRAHKEMLDRMTSDVQENINARKVIRGFHLQKAMADKFAARLSEMFRTHYRKNVVGAQLDRIPIISMLAVNLTIIALGSYLAIRGFITLGALVAFFTMYTSMGNSVFNLTYVIPVLTDVSVSLERLKRLMDAPEEPAGGPHRESLRERLPDIRFSDVSFRYDERRDALKRIDLAIAPGETAAFVGSSGSGKSTAVQLLLGFYEPSAGSILVNGRRLDEWDRGSLREQLGVVFQDSFLFRGTVTDNIRIAKPDASMEEIVAAAKRAEIHDFIASLPDGYETEVLDDGANFSGGQRQRLAIARAVLRDPPLLLLDEATSALDPISEASINRTFRDLAADRTVVTVTHRLSSITGADRIFVFDRGELVGGGTHAELLAEGGYYKELWDKQNGLAVSESGREANIDGERLARLPFFRGIEPRLLKEIGSLFDTETFEAGQTVIREGEAGEKFYLIARGRVEISKRDPEAEEGRLRLAVLEDGDHFGEIALLENVTRTADVATLSPCVFLTLQRKVLYYVLSHYPEIDARIRQTLRERKSS